MSVSAAQRRFLLGPLVALALLGPAGDNGGLGGGVPPDGSASPTPSAAERTRTVLFDALEAQQVYWVDHLVFAAGVGGELEELRRLDPTIGWGTAVVVEVPASEGEDNLVVVLRAPLPDGSSLCLSEVTTEQDAGLWFAHAAPGTACPKTGRGMRGWSPEETTAWS